MFFPLKVGGSEPKHYDDCFLRWSLGGSTCLCLELVEGVVIFNFACAIKGGWRRSDEVLRRNLKLYDIDGRQSCRNVR